MRKTKLFAIITSLSIAVVGAAVLTTNNNKVFGVNAASGTFIIIGDHQSGGWNNTDSNFAMTQKDGQYEFKNIHWTNGQNWRITWAGEWGTYAGWSTLQDKTGMSDGGSDNNIKTTREWYYDVYFKNNDGNKIYLANAAYSVKLNKNDGTISSGSDLEGYSYGESKTLPTLTKENYIFDGWFDNSKFEGTKITTISSTDHGNKEYWAKFHVDPESIKYTVTFNDEDGEFIETIEVAQGKSASCSTTPTKDPIGNKTFVFDKWVTSQGGSTAADLTNITSNMTVFASYKFDYKHGFYVMGILNGGDDWDNNSIENGYLMEEFNDAGYAYAVRATFEAKFGDSFKVVYYGSSGIDWDQSFGFSVLQDDSPALYCFGSDKDNNVIVWAGGEYTINLHNFESQGKTSYIKFSDDNRNSEQLAAKLMNFSNTVGTCQNDDRFSAMRTYYLGMDETEKENFRNYVELAGEASVSAKQFYGAYDRYTSWARALGENPWENSKKNLFKPFGLGGDMSEFGGNGSILYVVLITTLVAGLSVGGFFFYKKRKEN